MTDATLQESRTVQGTPCPCRDFEPKNDIDESPCVRCGHSGEEHNEHGFCLSGHRCLDCPCGYKHSHETDCWCEDPAPTREEFSALVDEHGENAVLDARPLTDHELDSTHDYASDPPTAAASRDALLSVYDALAAENAELREIAALWNAGCGCSAQEHAKLAAERDAALKERNLFEQITKGAMLKPTLINGVGGFEVLPVQPDPRIAAWRALDADARAEILHHINRTAAHRSFVEVAVFALEALGEKP